MADYDYIIETGVIVPDFANTLQEVVSEVRAFPGWANVDLSPETPQGVLVMAEALRRDNIARNGARLANQINPDIATGVFLDGICELTGCERFSATHSMLYGVQLAGTPTTVIPSGSLASYSGHDFRLTGTVILDGSGNGTGVFQAVESGPVPCPAGGLTTIASSVLGWETVTNPDPAVLGKNKELDYALRRRREKTLAAQASESVEAIISALYSLPDVRSLSFAENITSTPITIDNITLAPHSIYLCIDGGDGAEIARTLKRVRGLGSGYNGNETVTIVDEYSGQDYTIKYDLPRIVNIFAQVTIKATSINPSIVRELVVAFASGETAADEGFVVGRSVSPFEIAAGINALEPWLFVAKIEISDDGTTWSTDEYPIEIDQMAVITESSVQVIVI